MERKVDEKELKVQEDAIKEIIKNDGIKTLSRIDIRDKVFREVFADNIENKELSKDFQTYCENNVVVQTCIGKKWAPEKKLDYDYDASLYSTYIYRKTMDAYKNCSIYNSHGQEYIIKNESLGRQYRGDTMNSWSTTLNEFIRVLGEDFVHGHRRREKPEGYNKWEHFLSKPENYKKPLPWYITEFMDVVYTIGNFIPVPSDSNANFNKERNIPVGHNVKVKNTQNTGDYWDLTLLAVYQYYYGEEPSKLAALLGKKEIKEWLNSFGSGEEGWNEFVRQNFMQPFVEENEKGFGRPRELWDGHFEECVLPQNKAQFEQFFVNAKVRILARGKLIAEKLAKQLEE